MGNVILTGFMGSGKSSVAVKLSYRLKKAMVDTDKVIEKKQGKTITKIFEEDGEDAFRQMETDTLRSLKESSKNDIISVGGGTPMREENRALMKEMGTVVYLRVTPETVYERVKADGTRPLLMCEDPQGKIRELLEKRGPLYEDGAHVIIDVDGKNFGQILFEIERAVRSREMELRAQRQDGYRDSFRKEGYKKEFNRTGYQRENREGQEYQGGQHRYEGQRRYGEYRSYGEQRKYGGYGFNGFRRFGGTADEGAQQNAELAAGESQHAQNIQHALSENAQRQDRWQRRSFYGAAENAEPEKELTEETASAAENGKEEETAIVSEINNTDETEAVPEISEETEMAATDASAEQADAISENTDSQEPAASETIAKQEKTACENKRLTKLLVINGPNLNFLGLREKGIYGTQDYNYLLNLIAQKGIECGAAIEVYQSNHEGAIIDRIQASYFDGTEGIVINPGAYTHYSYAIRDALASIVVPKVEVHISNIMEREPFRRVSVTAPVCDRQIYGQGLDGYLQAIDFILDFKKNS